MGQAAIRPKSTAEDEKRRRCRIEQVIIAGDRIIIDGVCAPDLVLDRVGVRDPESGESLVLLAPSFVRRKAGNAASGATKNDPPQQFLLAVPLEEALPLDPLSRELVWTGMAIDVGAASLQCRARTIGTLAEPIEPDLAERIAFAGQCGCLDPAVSVALLGLSGHANTAHLMSDTDAISRVAGTVVFDGWVANARHRRIVVLTDDGTMAAQNDDLLFTSRPDVSTHLQGARLPVLTDYHGVIGVFPAVAKSVERLWVVSLDGERIERTHVVALARASSDKAVVDRMVGLCASGGFPDPTLTERLLLPLMRPAAPIVDWDSELISDPGGRPDLSIIVPLYKDWSFLRSLTTMQLACAANIEWIFVSDDPALHPHIRRYLKGRSSFLTNRTVLVCNHGNYGYSRANNIGAGVATADFLLFMNSDIWMADPAPVETALAAIEDGAFSIVGFRLLYEDETVQHDGMSFERNGYFNGLFTSEHKGKGLPARPAPLGSIRPAAAVTGAMLLCARTTFEEVGGFDDGFIKGDFEDGDLCLKVAEKGGRVGVLATDGVYHLERQSIRLMAKEGERQLITYLNCVRFNKRWGDALERLVA
jgi:O-antigen biosynthesis protein